MREIIQLNRMRESQIVPKIGKATSGWVETQGLDMYSNQTRRETMLLKSV
jgi:hypothetical protein